MNQAGTRRAGTSQREVSGPLTWAAIVVALLFGVTLSYVPYEFQGDGFALIYPQVRLLGLLFGVGGILLLLPRFFPALRWLDLPGCFLLVVPMAWLLAGFARQKGLLAAMTGFGLLPLIVPLGPLLEQRGIPMLRWSLTAFELLVGPAMLLLPSAFPGADYGFVASALPFVGVAFLLGGLGLLGTAGRAPADPLRRGAEVAAAVLLLVLALGLAENHRWLRAESPLVLAGFALLLPVWPRLHLRPRLAHRLIRAFTLAVLIPLLLLGGATSYFMQRVLQEQVFAGNATIAHGAAVLVRQYVQDGKSGALVTARQPATVAATAVWDTSLLERQIRVLYEESGLFRGIWLLDSAGTVRVTYPASPAVQGASLAEAPYFRQAVRAREATTGAVVKSALAGAPLVVPFAVPLQDSTGRLLGVLVAMIDLGELSEHLGAIQVGQTGHVRLVDQDGRTIAHPNLDQLGQPIDAADLAAQRALAGKSGVVEVVDRQERRQLAAYEYVPDLGWALVAELPTAEAYRPITTLAALFLSFLAVASIATIGLAIAVSLQITGPLRTLQATAGALSRGDLDRRITLATGDELEDLGEAFNRMAGELQRLVRQLVESERALARTNVELRAVLDGVGSAVVMVDPTRQVRYANRRVRDLLGLDPAEILGQPVDRVVAGIAARLAEPAAFQAKLARLDQHPQEVIHDEVELWNPWQVLMRFSSPVCLDGTVLGRLEVYEDITRVRESERLKNEFLLLVSHEFRTPLTVALGNTAMARRLLDPLKSTLHEAVRRLEDAERGERRLISMVEELLDVAAIDAGRLQLRKEAVALPSLVQEVLGRLQPTLQSHRVAVDVPPGFPSVAADRRRIAQIVANFLTNAARYTTTGTLITVQLERRGGEAVFSVVDQGTGIGPEDIPRLFNRFHRAQTLVGQAKEGLGLGLYIDKAIAEAHGGRLWVESRLGQGATFSFSLPLGDVRPSAPAGSPSLVNHHGGSTDD